MSNKYSTQISYSVQSKLISETLTTATNASSAIPETQKFNRNLVQLMKPLPVTSTSSNENNVQGKNQTII